MKSSRRRARLLVKRVPGLRQQTYVPCGCIQIRYQTFTRYRSIGASIIHLNDIHRWSREEIADWLDTLEVDLVVRKKQSRLSAWLERHTVEAPPGDMGSLDERDPAVIEASRAIGSTRSLGDDS